VLIADDLPASLAAPDAFAAGIRRAIDGYADAHGLWRPGD